MTARDDLREAVAKAIQSVQGGVNYDYADFCRDAADAALREAIPRIEAGTIAALNQPGSIHAHMLRGVLKPMSLRDCLHLHGITAKAHWGALTIEQALEIADAAAIRNQEPNK